VTTSAVFPRLAVHVGREVPEALAAVLTAATPWADVVAAAVQEPLLEGVRAHLYTSDVLPRRPETPYAVWRLAGTDPADSPATVVLGEVVDTGAPGGELGVSLGVWPADARPILPFTRSRYRLLRGLPDSLVTVATGDGLRWGAPGKDPAPAPGATWPTLAALSSAVVADGERVRCALAWAAPTVTDTATARLLALMPGEHVLVDDDPHRREELARELADDEARAAQLAQRGWSALRTRRAEAVAEELCRRLGFRTRRDVPSPSRLTAELDALAAPPTGLVRSRAREAIAILPGAVTSGWRPAERRSREQS
jgi:hypothetical protein